MANLCRILMLLALALTAGAAQAHPHVWIVMTSAVLYAPDGTVTGVRHAWTFDEFYSQFATDRIDRNKNGKFDPPELQELANSYAKNLKDFRYFTYIQAGGRSVEPGAPTNARAAFDKGQLTFAFRLPLAKPVDPATAKFSYASFDPTYYIDIAPVQVSPVAFSGTPRQGCGFNYRKVDSTKAGALNLAQSITMVAPTNDVLNSTNAAIVDVTCPLAKTQ